MDLRLEFGERQCRRRLIDEGLFQVFLLFGVQVIIVLGHGGQRLSYFETAANAELFIPETRFEVDDIGNPVAKQG